MIIRNHPYRNHNHVSLLQSGESYFTKLEQLIEEAKFSIHLQVYIFNNDLTGKRMLQKLKDAANRGVSVYLVIDAYASKDFTPRLINELRGIGIWVKKFAPLHLKHFKIGRRLHHKIVMIDEQYALIGGINIADHYSGQNGQVPWLDMAVCVSGPIIFDIKKVCLAIWKKRVRKKWKKQALLTHHPAGHTKLKLLQSDWWRRRIEISSAYNNAIRNAQHDLTIVASYFLPGFTKRRLLKKAAMRGVKVTLITGHESDIPFMNAAVKYLYGILLQNNVTIYEWNKSVLHAKIAIADGNWSTIGSYNLNSLSDYGSLEANVEVVDEIFARQLQDFLDEIIQTGCTPIDSKHFIEHTTLLQKIYRWTCYKFMRALLFVLFMLMSRDRLKQ